jgi:hypothetical protein
MKIQSLEDLKNNKSILCKQIYMPEGIKVNIGMASCGIAAGAQAALKDIENYKEIQKLKSARPDASASASRNPWWKSWPRQTPDDVSNITGRQNHRRH